MRHHETPCNSQLATRAHSGFLRLLAIAMLAAPGACGGNEADDEPASGALGAGCDPEQPGCNPELVCAEISADEHRCFEPVILRGSVTDSSSGEPIADAHVIAIDGEGVAISDVALTDAEGNYELDIPVGRDSEGVPVETTFTLRAAAQLYQPFPSGIRVALPVSTSEAHDEGEQYVIDTTLTDLTLIRLAAGSLHAIGGRVVPTTDSDAELGGVLVVATGGDGEALSAVTDRSGSFTIFNVPDGAFEVRGYAAGIQIQPEAVSVDGDVMELELLELAQGTTSLSGNIQIVNAPGGSLTSVILVVEDTFDPTMARGEVPRGLRAPESGPPNVGGDFNISGVPAGRYVVLAAYENDDMVRDPDTNIGGTGFVTVEVGAGQDQLSLSDSFKVTEALGVVSPGDTLPTPVSEPPMLRWVDDSSEDWYEVRVFNALGDEVWSDADVPSVSGAAEASIAYGGPLEPGMYYQFRVTSWRQPGGQAAAPISTTEDLRGVFFKPFD